MITKKRYEKLKNHNATIFAVLDIQGRKCLCMYKLYNDCTFENLEMFEAVFENRFEVEVRNIKKKPKRITKFEFRFNFNTKHTNFIFEQENNKYHGIGLTHSAETFDKKRNKMRQNIPLFENPQKNKKDKAYIRYGIITNTTASYGEIRKNFKFAPDDIPTVKFIARNYKKKRKGKHSTNG